MSSVPGHPPLSLLQQYVDDHVPGALTDAGEPPARWRVEPGLQRLSLAVPAAGPQPDVTGLARFGHDRVHSVDGPWDQVWVEYGQNLDHVHAALCSVLDRVRDGTTLAAALQQVVGGLRDVLAPRARLTDEAEVGLLGELLVVAALARVSGPVAAATAWRGAQNEEHDFGLPHLDLEVKTTRAERRTHWISSLTQLVPTGERPLHLLSLQVTRAGAGEGVSLRSVVERLLALPGMPLDDMAAKLQAVGYRSADADLYGRSWLLRTPPRFYPVDVSFPSLRPDLLSGVAHTDRLVQVRYRVDLEGLPAGQALLDVEEDAR